MSQSQTQTPSPRGNAGTCKKLDLEPLYDVISDRTLASAIRYNQHWDVVPLALFSTGNSGIIGWLPDIADEDDELNRMEILKRLKQLERWGLIRVTNEKELLFETLDPSVKCIEYTMGGNTYVVLYRVRG